MVAISATNSATPSLQSVLGRNKLAQAKREASQAEATAQNLRAQADAAELDAEKSNDRVRKLKNTSSPAEAPTYTRPAQGSQSESSRVVLAAQYNASALKTNQDAAPVQNAQGQTTGRIVNVTA